MTLDLQAIRAVAIDIADTYEDHDLQDQTAEVVWHLLERGYQIYLFSSNQNRDLRREDFRHPRLRFLAGPFPPPQTALSELEDLGAPTTLWYSDDPAMLRWLRERGLPYATRREVPPHRGEAWGLRLGSIGDLLEALSPSRRVYEALEAALNSLRARNPDEGLIVGIGGPPASGYQQLAVELKRHLEASGYPLVELLDLSAFLRGGHDAPETFAGEAIWRDPEAGQWLLHEVLGPLKQRHTVALEALPEEVPQAFAPHLPLFLTGESVVLAFAEMPFAPPLVELLDLSVLLDLTPWEATRRLYEIDEEEVDPHFAEQYLAHEGRAYDRYLEHNAVRQRVDCRVDASVPGVFRLLR